MDSELVCATRPGTRTGGAGKNASLIIPAVADAPYQKTVVRAGRWQETNHETRSNRNNRPG